MKRSVSWPSILIAIDGQAVGLISPAVFSVTGAPFSMPSPPLYSWFLVYFDVLMLCRGGDRP
ncbi:hypothetical protein PIB30_080804 [Stylosanthes scabra]|uniref:Uncharacterized protein n=1 Tax=Stylosanthes scabra TaxID=79078 RepID=A0ABU6TSW4_9FABA|nr:hypothetical protein [Stylosanthes scabra]